MSDATLRALERRWRESGSVADEAAWLTARSRAGDLARERLELAAYCGHAAARQAVGEEETIARASYLGDFAAVRVALGEPLLGANDLLPWLEGLVAWGDQVCSLATLAALDVALERCEPLFGTGPRTYASPAFRWRDEGRVPSESERRQVVEEGAEVDFRYLSTGYEPEDELRLATWSLARAALTGRFQNRELAASAGALAQTRLDPERIRAAVCSALVAWSIERAL